MSHVPRNLAQRNLVDTDMVTRGFPHRVVDVVTREP
jgi:hypothetical protein